jgi:tetratricopeptide (TPR) repeat protein
MSDIQLQDYAVKVKDLIQNHRLDEAIAHCQHILRHYPKHVKTYVLLGEACLEKKLFREAVELFQRTLSADPENLISRVGLAMIFDEQAALPEAIWQMERAFELAPGNAEVRRELQHLYARSEAVERARLKLTRGALGRLYARNGLYERAIGEFRAVLRQEPELPDAQVALLEALWHEGRRLEAVEVAQALLEQLPNCLKANLILGEIWMDGGYEDAAQEKLDVARALDPEGLVAQEMLGTKSPLPLEEVFVPELEVTPDVLAAALATTGLLVPSSPLAEERVGPEEAVAEEPQPEELAMLPEEEEEGVPEWMRGIGIVEEELAPELETEAPIEEAAFEEEAPEWLQELVDEEDAVPLEAGVSPEDRVPAEEAPEWLQELEEPADEEFTLPPDAETVFEAPAEDVPEWLQEVEVAVVADEALGEAGEPLEEVTPSAEEIESVPVETVAEEAVPPEEVPEWLQDLGAMPEEGISVKEPSLAEGVALAAAGVAAAEIISPEESPEEAQEPEVAEEVTVPAATETMFEAPTEEAPEWLEDWGMETEEPIPEAAEALPEEEAPDEDVPEWLRGVEVPEVEEAAPSPVSEELEEVVEPPAEDVAPVSRIPKSLQALAAAGIIKDRDLESLVADTPEEDLEAQRAETMPDWLTDMVAGQQVLHKEEDLSPEGATPLVAEEPRPEETMAPDEELPVWLQEIAAPEVEAPPPEGIVPVVGEPVAEEPSPEEAPAPDEELPVWLQEIAVPEVVEAPPPEDVVPFVDEAAADEPPPEEALAPDEELPTWAQGIVAPEVKEKVPAVEEAPPLAEAVVEDTTQVEDILDWLQEAEEEVALEEAIAPDEEVPESLQALVDAGILDEADLDSMMTEMSEEQLEVQRTEAVPGWLTDLMGDGAVPSAEDAVAAVEEVPPEEEARVPLAESPAEELVPAEEALLLEEAVAAAEVEIEEPAEEVPPLEEAVAAAEAEIEEAAPAEEVVAAAEVEIEEAALAEEAVAAAEVEIEEIVLAEEAVAAAEVEIEEIVLAEEAPPMEEPAEEVPPVEEAVAAAEAEAPPETEVAPPTRADELLAQLQEQSTNHEARLELAQLYGAQGDWTSALNQYERLISARASLPAVVDDLLPLVERQVEPARAYQLLGDAYMQEDRLDEALEMYRRARQALR